MLNEFVENFAPAYVDRTRPEHVEAYYVKRKGEVTTATANSELTILRAALGHAERLGLVRKNPALSAAVPRDRTPDKPVRALSKEECQRLVAAAPDEYWRALIVVGIQSGMRKSEFYRLEWRDVDVLTGAIKVENKPTAHGGSTKSKRNRTVNVDAEGCRMLTSLRVRHPEARRVFLDTAGHLTKNRITRGFKDVVKAAELEDVTLHTLRHTCATLLAASGMSSIMLKRYMGHSSISTTDRYYTGSLDGATRELTHRVFGGVFADTSPTKP